MEIFPENFQQMVWKNIYADSMKHINKHCREIYSAKLFFYKRDFSEMKYKYINEWDKIRKRITDKESQGFIDLRQKIRDDYNNYIANYSNIIKGYEELYKELEEIHNKKYLNR